MVRACWSAFASYAVGLLLAIALSGCASTAVPERIPDPLFGLGDREMFVLHSQTLDRDFHILVRLPRSYDESERSYPMALLLDGGILFPMLVPFQLLMEVQDNAEELIVVGVSYGGLGFANGNLRGTDYTAPSPDVAFFGGAMAYQDFLADELLPRLQADYRLDAGRRLLLGQSLGGQFAIHAALTRPELFSTYVAVNPALHANLDHFLALVPQADAAPTRLLVALGTEDDPRFRLPTLEWLERRPTCTECSLTLELLELPDGHHATSAPAAYFEVVSRLFPAPIE